MKNIFSKISWPLKYILLFVLATTISCCHKDDDDQPTNPVDQLPPATQTGAGTFGCLLDGEVFIPDNLPNRTNCFYQFLNGEYFFTVRASKRINGDENTIAIKTEEKQINEGESYDLFENQPGNAYGEYSFYPFFNYTTHTHRKINHYQIRL